MLEEATRDMRNLSAQLPFVWVLGCGGRRAQAEVNCDCGALYLVEVVVEVEDRGLQALVTEKHLDLADVEAALQPAFGGEATQAMEGIGWRNQRLSVLRHSAPPWRPRNSGPVGGKPCSAWRA